MRSLKYIIIILFFVLSGCRTGDRKGNSKSSEPGNRIESAERFTLEQRNFGTEVRIIDPWQGANGITQTYSLVKRGSPVPQGMDSSSVIFVPVHKIVCMSTTHISMVSALGEEETIIGVSGTNLIYSPSVMRNVEKGSVAEVGYEASLNKELILKIHPDLIIIYGIGSESSGYIGKIKELGIKVLINADYLETDPLGRAEWIKLFGALYCKEDMADSIFKNEFNKYNKLKTFIAQNITKRPKVLLGLPFKDSWYISPGNSYISKLIGDAGGDYLWNDTRSQVSMPYSIEDVYMHGLKADFWLNIGTVNSRDEISIIDPRLNDLPCYKNDNLFNNNKRTTVEGGNDYWENGVLYPHLLLEDIASILHSEILKEHELVFYKKIY